jgi:hypothetical protein
VVVENQGMDKHSALVMMENAKGGFVAVARSLIFHRNV